MSIEAPSSALGHQAVADSDGSLQLVSFRLGGEEYGMEIHKVREIILVGTITHLPRTPDHVKGVINLRDTMIPIVDLNLRFGLAATEVGDDTRIMVIDVEGHMIGIMVDEVSEVLRVSPDQITPPPPTIVESGQNCLTGLARLAERILILLDIDKTLGDTPSIQVTNAASADQANVTISV